MTAQWTANQITVNYTDSYYASSDSEKIGTVTVKNASGTTIATGTKVAYDSSITITVSATTIGKFSELKINGTKVTPTSGSYTYTVKSTTGVTIEATFLDNRGTITYNPGY